VRALFLLALCALAAVGCGGGAAMEEAAPTTTTTTTSEPAPPADANRPPAPAIEGVSLDGESISLADLRGRPVFVNVWSSW
jgi:ABC-type glycerol-3-phosphate transport system substrate-binding protein